MQHWLEPRSQSPTLCSAYMNAAARVVSDTRKFDHGMTPNLVRGPTLARCGRSSHIQTWCPHGKAPQYLVDCCTCTPLADVVGRRRLRSATQRLSTVGRRAFAEHGPMVWNSLPDNLCTQHDVGSFKQGLKTWLFLGTSVHSALETFATIALYKSTYTIPYHWQCRFSDGDQLFRCEVISTRPVHNDVHVRHHPHHHLHLWNSLERHW